MFIFVQNSTVNDIPDESESSKNNIEHQIYPEPVMDALQTVKNIKAGTSIIVGDETFIIVSFGPKTGTGYGAKIKEIKKTEDKLIVTAEPGTATDPTVETISYDYAVEAVKGKYNNVDFKTNEEYTPRIVGLEESIPKPKEIGKNIIIFDSAFNSKSINIEGIVRVFEANLQYEVYDNEGRAIKEGYVTARGGAPDWGYFLIELNEEKDFSPENAEEILLFEQSAKDGSKIELIRLLK
jgi:hypothetical protein